MPLRDHFRSPVNDKHRWDELHGMWPGTIVRQLFDILPAGYVAGPTVHLGKPFEIDVSTYEEVEPSEVGPTKDAGEGGVATMASPAPTLTLQTDLTEHDEYEVRVYDAERGRQLVAAIEIVIPRNKDRPEARDAFVSKCHALLQQEVCVVNVDPVTTRTANLYGELVRRIGAKLTTVAAEPIYAVACRFLSVREKQRVEVWDHALAVGSPLPTLPLWISETRYVPLELERTYEDTCRGLRIA